MGKGILINGLVLLWWQWSALAVDPPPRRTVALVLTGEPRTVSYTQTYIVLFASQMAVTWNASVDTFASFNLGNRKQTEGQLPNLAAELRAKEWNFHYNAPPNVFPICTSFTTGSSKLTNAMYHMMGGLKAGYFLAVAEELRRGFRYDYVVRYRFDIVCPPAYVLTNAFFKGRLFDNVDPQTEPVLAMNARSPGKEGYVQDFFWVATRNASDAVFQFSDTFIYSGDPQEKRCQMNKTGWPKSLLPLGNNQEIEASIIAYARSRVPDLRLLDVLKFCCDKRFAVDIEQANGNAIPLIVGKRHTFCSSTNFVPTMDELLGPATARACISADSRGHDDANSKKCGW